MSQQAFNQKLFYVNFSSKGGLKGGLYLIKSQMRLHHVLGGSTGPRCSMLHFDLHEKNILGENDTSFIRDKCCHLALCLRLMELNRGVRAGGISLKRVKRPF